MGQVMLSGAAVLPEPSRERLDGPDVMIDRLDSEPIGPKPGQGVQGLRERQVGNTAEPGQVDDALGSVCE
jgi:hypothetical protein